eukprot:SAG31_NODE_3882_length_3789_cov_1.497561_5_plen_88_part_01
MLSGLSGGYQGMVSEGGVSYQAWSPWAGAGGRSGAWGRRGRAGSLACRQAGARRRATVSTSRRAVCVCVHGFTAGPKFFSGLFFKISK